MIITESYKPSTQVLAAQSKGAAKQKTQTETKQSVQPAYQVDISPPDERAQGKARLEEMFSNVAGQVTLTFSNWTN